jgi:serine/threonine-protein kinase
MEENGKAGKYDIRTVIGRGAAGVVYEGWDPVLERKVAIKTLPLDVHDEEAREQYTRFQQEAQAAARLHHPNIVSVFDYGETATHAFIVMEFLGGGSLKSRLERKDRMSLVEVVRVMRGVLAGLYHSHAHGVVHRDVKPANIVFDDAGEVKITDFGIARLENSKLTLDGALLGTPAYMSPEQVLGETADVRSDIYSAGVILYELLTGQRPFEGTASSNNHKKLHSPPPRVDSAHSGAPAFRRDPRAGVGEGA